MENNQMNAKKVEQLLQMASKKLGVSPNTLKNQLQQGNVQNMIPSGKVDLGKVQNILNDPQKMQQLLNTPQAKKLMSQLTEDR